MEAGCIVKVVMISNYFNHHQKPLCEAMYQSIGEDFKFVVTADMREDRKRLGYGMDETPSYVVDSRKSEENLDFIDDADVVIFGSAPESLIENRKKQRKLIFRYSERPLKKGNSLLKYFPRLLMWHWKNPCNAPIYMLCASAYTAADYAMYGLFRKRAYQWGYFPQAEPHDIDLLMQRKDPVEIFWCGRLIDWKHPDDAIGLAKRLKEAGLRFHMTIVGTGDMEQVLKEMVQRDGLQGEVSMPGALKPMQVRGYMERAGIYLATSDFQEGWGAVVNEAMNSGCAVVASHAIGAVPLLIRDGENGRIYENGNIEALYQIVCSLLNNTRDQVELGGNAYLTIAKVWNADVAAKRFLKLAGDILASGDGDLYQDGPCARARILGNDWWTRLKK